MRNYELIGRRVEERFPFLLPELERVPVLTDINHVDKLFKEYSKQFIARYGDRQKHERQFRIIFVAVVIKLYCPEYVDGYAKKIKNGLRSKIAGIFHFSQANVTKIIKYSLKNLGKNTNFLIEVEYFYEVLKNIICRKKN